MKAFPDGRTNQWGNATAGGMDLRDYFAANIMLGLMREFHDDIDWDAHENADLAYQIADAMMQARAAQ